jgi:hypothetical protein
MKIEQATSLTNAELVTAIARLAGNEREATVAFIVHLAEFDARRLYAAAGFSSTFRYCLEELHLSEDAAFNRIEAARAARAYPAIVDMLITGALSPTTARMLGRHLTQENHQRLLAAAPGKSKQQVESLLAGLFPRPDVPPSVRALPAARSAIGVAASATTAAPAPSMPVAETLMIQAPSSASAERPAPAPPRPIVRPLSAQRYEIRFTARAETHEKLRKAQDLLGHAVPSGDLAEVFDRALTLLVEDLQKKKFAVTRRSRPSRGQAQDSRNIPADVQRAVVARDGVRCAFVAASGRRCGEGRRLEFHHHGAPYGIGGKPTVDNISLRCQTHTAYEADQFYGPRRRYAAGDAGQERMAVYGRVSGEVTRSGTGDHAIGETNVSSP